MKLINLSIRARVAYATMCLELLLKENKVDYLSDIGLKMVLDLCWSYTNINPGVWHYKMAELSPDSVEENLPFIIKGFEYFNNSEPPLSGKYFLEIPASNQSASKLSDYLNIAKGYGIEDILFLAE